MENVYKPVKLNIKLSEEGAEMLMWTNGHITENDTVPFVVIDGKRSNLPMDTWVGSKLVKKDEEALAEVFTTDKQVTVVFPESVQGSTSFPKVEFSKPAGVTGKWVKLVHQPMPEKSLLTLRVEVDPNDDLDVLLEQAKALANKLGLKAVVFDKDGIDWEAENSSHESTFL